MKDDFLVMFLVQQLNGCLPKSRVTRLKEFSQGLDRFLEEVLKFGRTMEANRLGSFL